MQNSLLFPGFDKIFTESDWKREVEKVGAYCTSVEKAVAAKIPDLIIDTPAEVPIVPRKKSQAKSKSNVDPENPTFRLSVPKMGSLKHKLSFKKSSKSVKIDEEKTDGGKPSTQVLESDRGHVNQVGPQFHAKSTLKRDDHLSTEHDVGSLDFSTDDEEFETRNGNKTGGFENSGVDRGLAPLHGKPSRNLESGENGDFLMDDEETEIQTETKNKNKTDKASTFENDVLAPMRIEPMPNANPVPEDFKTGKKAGDLDFSTDDEKSFETEIQPKIRSEQK